MNDGNHGSLNENHRAEKTPSGFLRREKPVKKTLCLLLGLALCVPSLALASGRTVRISGGYVEEYWT